MRESMRHHSSTQISCLTFPTEPWNFAKELGHFGLVLKTGESGYRLRFSYAGACGYLAVANRVNIAIDTCHYGGVSRNCTAMLYRVLLVIPWKDLTIEPTSRIQAFVTKNSLQKV